MSARAERDAILTRDVGVRLTPEYVANACDLEPADFTMTDPSARQGPQDGAGAPNAGEGGGRAGPGKFGAATARKYSAVQQGIEDGIQNLEITDPIDPELIRAAVLAALVDKVDPRFVQALERASFAAAVLGYVAAQRAGRD